MVSQNLNVKLYSSLQ